MSKGRKIVYEYCVSEDIVCTIEYEDGKIKTSNISSNRSDYSDKIFEMLKPRERDIILALCNRCEGKSGIQIEYDSIAEDLYGHDAEARYQSTLRRQITSIKNKFADIDQEIKFSFSQKDSRAYVTCYIERREIQLSEEKKHYEICRKKIADAYYENYKLLMFQHTSVKINQSLMDVFCFPTFVGGELLDLSKSNNVFICAPNGFGKSTLLKALLFATNPSSKLDERIELVERITELKNHYGIKEDYLTLYVDLKDINNKNAFKNEEDLCRWLLFASHLDGLNGLKLKLDDFRELVTYYNQKGRLMLIFDSIDEVIQDQEKDISRDDVLTKIRLLICADEIGSNAKIIVASRPLVFSEDDMPYRYLYIESLISHQERVETIIEKYSPEYKDDLVEYIYGDLYLKYLVVTPQLLIDVISRILLNKYNENTGISGGGKYKLIKSIIRNTMMRFKNKGNRDYLEKNYEHIYEIFSYVSLFNNIENRRDDFAEFQELILHNELNYVERRKKPISQKDIIDAYEHFCLFNTQGQTLELLASEVLEPYYLASYMYKFCALSMNTEMHCQTKIWKKFETILNNKYKMDDYLYDMLVFFFGIIHEGITEDQRYNPDSLEYNVWIDYIVYKWNSVNDCETSKRILRERLKYLLESDFVKDSCFKRILASDSDLSENEIQLKFILNEIN